MSTPSLEEQLANAKHAFKVIGEDFELQSQELRDTKKLLVDSNALNSIQRDEIKQLKEAMAELVAQRIKQDQLYQDLKNQACADGMVKDNRIAELQKHLADLKPFVLEDYYPNCAMPDYKAAVGAAYADVKK